MLSEAYFPKGGFIIRSLFKVQNRRAPPPENLVTPPYDGSATRGKPSSNVGQVVSATLAQMLACQKTADSSSDDPPHAVVDPAITRQTDSSGWDTVSLRPTDVSSEVSPTINAPSDSEWKKLQHRTKETNVSTQHSQDTDPLSTFLEMGDVMDGSTLVRHDGWLNAYRSALPLLTETLRNRENSKKFSGISEDDPILVEYHENIDTFLSDHDRLLQTLQSTHTEEWAGDKELRQCSETVIESLKKVTKSLEVIGKNQTKSSMPGNLDLAGTAVAFTMGTVALLKSGKVVDGTKGSYEAFVQAGMMANVGVQALKGIYKYRHIAAPTDILVPTQKVLLEVDSMLKLLLAELTADETEQGAVSAVASPPETVHASGKDSARQFADMFSRRRDEFNQAMNIALEQWEFAFLQNATYTEKYLKLLRRNQDNASTQLTNTLYSEGEITKALLEEKIKTLEDAKKDLDAMIKALKPLFDKSPIPDRAELTSAVVAGVGSFVTGVLGASEFFTANPSIAPARTWFGGVNVAAAAAATVTKQVHARWNVNRSVLQPAGHKQDQVDTHLNSLQRQLKKAL